MNADARLVRIKLLGRCRKRTSLVATTGTPRLAASVTAPAMYGSSTGAAQALQLEVVALGETAPATPRARVRRRARGPWISARPTSPSAAPESAIRPARFSHVQPAALDARRAALLALEIGAADEAGEVAVAARRLAQQREAGGRLAFALPRTSRSTPTSGFTPALECLAIELHHREEVVLVGHRHGRHAGGGGRGHQFRNAHHAVAEGVLSVQAQVDEAVVTSARY